MTVAPHSPLDAAAREMQPSADLASHGFELFGAATGNCFRAAICLEELGVGYTATRVDLRSGEHRRGEHLRRNPDGKVPTLVVARPGKAPWHLSQSNAIMLFLDSLAPGRLMPSDPFERGIALERYMYFLTEVIGVNAVAFRVRAAIPQVGINVMDALAVRRLEDGEKFLSGSPWFSGRAFGLADIAAVTIAHAYKHLVAWEDHPRLLDWYEAARLRPSFARGTTVFGSF